jgi:hypothetical protein
MGGIMKVTAEIDYIDDCYGEISIDEKIKIELVQIITERIKTSLINQWEGEIINAVKERIKDKVDELIGSQFDNMVGEKISLFIEDKVKQVGKELLKNKLSTMLERLMRD